MGYADQVIPVHAPEREVQLDSIHISALKLALQPVMKDPQVGFDLYFTAEGLHYFNNPPPIPATCVRICARYLYEALQDIHLNAVVQYDTDLNPLLIRNGSDLDHIEVVMPMRK
jgi:hypothetical protein